MKENVYSAPFWARLAIAAVIAGFIVVPAGNVAWVAVGQVQFGQLLKLIDLTELHPVGGLIALGLLLVSAAFGFIAIAATAAGLRVLFDPLFPAPVDLAENQPTE